MSAVAFVRPKITGVSGTITDTFSITAKQTVVVSLWNYSYVYTTGDVTDNLNGSYGAPSRQYSNPGNSDRCAVFVKRNSLGGTVTVSVNNCSYTVAIIYVLNCKANAKIQVTAGSTNTGTACTSLALSPYWPLPGSTVIQTMTHNVGDGSLTEQSGWTMGGKQENYSGDYQPGASQYIDVTSGTSLTGTVTLGTGATWSTFLIVITDPPSIYQVLGGGGTGWVDDDPTDAITLPTEVLEDQAVIIPVGMYAWDMAPEYLDDDGANTWLLAAQQSWDHVGSVGSRDGSATLLYSVLGAPITTISIDTSSVSTDDPAAARWYRWSAVVVEEPDLVLGFFTAAPDNAAQVNLTVVAPGSVTPASDSTLDAMCFVDRGHAVALSPVTFSTEVDELTYDGTENSAHQSGSWGFGFTTSTSAQSPTCTLATESVAARSCCASFNIAGGTPPPGGDVFSRRTLTSHGIGRRALQGLRHAA